MRRNPNSAARLIREWRAQDMALESVYAKRYDALGEDAKQQLDQIIEDVYDTAVKYMDSLTLLTDEPNDQNLVTKMNQSLNEILRSVEGAYMSLKELHLITTDDKRDTKG
jgi:hypothetical protein